MQQGRVLKAFKAASHAAGRLVQTGVVYGGLISTSAYATDSLVNKASRQALTMGGFAETAAPMTEWPPQQRNDMLFFREKYLAGRKSLDSAIASCHRGAACEPNVRLFIDMIDWVHRIKGRQLQAQLVQAWVATFIRFDNNEIANNAPRGSMLQALAKKQGVCDEMAQLKLAALEMLGFPARDLRWVSEFVFAGGAPQKTGHAVVELRLNGRNWVLDYQQAPLSMSTLDRDDIWQLIGMNSLIERDDNQLNSRAQSYTDGKEMTFLPWASFNSVQTHAYLGVWPSAPYAAPLPPLPPPDGPDKNSLDRNKLSPATAREVERILRPAIAAHYAVNSAVKLHYSSR